MHAQNSRKYLHIAWKLPHWVLISAGAAFLLGLRSGWCPRLWSAPAYSSRQHLSCHCHCDEQPRAVFALLSEAFACTVIQQFAQIHCKSAVTLTLPSSLCKKAFKKPFKFVWHHFTVHCHFETGKNLMALPHGYWFTVVLFFRKCPSVGNIKSSISSSKLKCLYCFYITKIDKKNTLQKPKVDWIKAIQYNIMTI